MTDPIELTPLVKQVQFNCDISDANHAGNYTLCIYLLKMREYYRWIHALEFTEDFDNNRMTQWLRQKEDTWDQVAELAFREICVNQHCFDPFNSKEINQHLQPQRLFYHAGIGEKAVQHFFIAELESDYHQDGIGIRVTGKEYARDLTAPPAISNQGQIIIRLESLKRMCWERYQEWNWSRLENPMATALAYYPFDESIPDALEQMVTIEKETLIHHEIGEMQVTERFGQAWPELMLKLLGGKAEILARAIRDNLADSLTTLPYLLNQDNPAPIHFYFANLAHLRKQLFPTAVQAYRNWTKSNDRSELEDLIPQAAHHWNSLISQSLAIADASPQNPAPDIIQLIENDPL